MPHFRVGAKIRNYRHPNDLEPTIWVDWDLTGCGSSGAQLYSSIFTKCHFEDTDFYWCSAFQATFIDCKFVNCDLRGSFTETRFIRCGFVHCQVGDNELGGKTEWKNTVALECVIAGSPLPIVEAPDEIFG